MSNMTDNGELIEIEKMSIDQFAGSVVLILGAVFTVSLAPMASPFTEAILATLDDFANVSPPADNLLDFTSKFVVS